MKHLPAVLFAIILLTASAHSTPAQDLQWEQKTVGGWFNCIAVNGTAIFAGTNAFGVYRSTNNGDTWEQVGLSHLFVKSLVVKGTTLLAGTTDSGIYRSIDLGNTWTRVTSQAAFGIISVYALAVSGTAIFAGVFGYRGEIFHSTDDGIIWINTGTVSESVFSIYKLAANGSTVFAGTDRGVYRTMNNGYSWDSLGFGGSTTSALALNGVVLFTAEDGIIYRFDKGTWTQTMSGSYFTGGSSIVFDGSNIFVAGGDSVFQSTDNGNSWQAQSAGLSTSTITSLAISGTDIYAATTHGIFRASLSGSTVPALSDKKEVGIATYPDPFNISTTIDFIVPERCMVMLEVFDMLGRKIKIIMNEMCDPGRYEKQFDATLFPVGIYTAKLTCGISHHEVKMVISR